MNLSNSLYKYLILSMVIFSFAFMIKLTFFKIAMFRLKLLHSINILSFRYRLIILVSNFKTISRTLTDCMRRTLNFNTFFGYNPPLIIFFILHVHPLFMFLPAYPSVWPSVYLYIQLSLYCVSICFFFLLHLNELCSFNLKKAIMYKLSVISFKLPLSFLIWRRQELFYMLK